MNNKYKIGDLITFNDEYDLGIVLEKKKDLISIMWFFKTMEKYEYKDRDYYSIKRTIKKLS